ncbi:hypothetical protein [Paenibacillus sp. HGF5]|uniref:hypothetical protein n=1 Tax=Paenibacillus sp. HGF5 TaxID=908341 RepID=UPI0002072D5F|nr:hypothetical protein [Paenibacillus sp. HGF5]EGG35240.1 conserved domain protein [Paenibacillus sp. HGF5]
MRYASSLKQKDLVGKSILQSSFQVTEYEEVNEFFDSNPDCYHYAQSVTTKRDFLTGEIIATGITVQYWKVS